MSTQSSDRFRVVLLSVTLVMGACLTPALGRAQENGDCLACHSDKDLSKVRGGKKVSLFIDEAKLGASVHGKALCVDCHTETEMHGDGTIKSRMDQATQIRCATCHGQIVQGRQTIAARQRQFHPAFQRGFQFIHHFGARRSKHNQTGKTARKET